MTSVFIASKYEDPDPITLEDVYVEIGHKLISMYFLVK